MFIHECMKYSNNFAAGIVLLFQDVPKDAFAELLLCEKISTIERIRNLTPSAEINIHELISEVLHR
jgi:hypothetical protein